MDLYKLVLLIQIISPWTVQIGKNHTIIEYCRVSSVKFRKKLNPALFKCFSETQVFRKKKCHNTIYFIQWNYGDWYRELGIMVLSNSKKFILFTKLVWRWRQVSGRRQTKCTDESTWSSGCWSDDDRWK